MGARRLAIEPAEEKIRRKAAEHAYQVTNNIEDPKIQRITYTLVKESIILGARMMQEEITINSSNA